MRALLRESDLLDLLDDAMLLTTELTTNAVLHAGTEIDVHMSVDATSITVEVTDRCGGDLPPVDVAASIHAPLAPDGRGLLLVDQLAHRWGMVHTDDGKTVWFQLCREMLVPRRAPSVATQAACPVPADRQPLTDVLAGRVLDQLVALAGAGGAEVWLDRHDGRGVESTRSGEVDRDRAVRVPLALGELWHGELLVDLNRPDEPAGLVDLNRPGEPDRLDERVTRIVELSAGYLGLMFDNERLRAADRRRRMSLAFLAETSELLARSVDIGGAAALIPRLLVPRFGEWSAVYRCDDRGELELAAVTHRDEAGTAALRARLDEPGSRRVLREILHNGYHATLPAGLDGIAVPLMVAGRRLGVLAVGRPPRRRHDIDELAVVHDLARRTALAIDKAAAAAERVHITDTLQQALLPPVLPDIAGLGFGAEYVPTIGTAEVGGDFYDVLPLGGGRCLMVIGDVSGKGLAAATVTGLVRDVIRILVREGRSLPEILGRVNEALAERGAGRFATLAIASVLTDGIHLRVTLYLAGHDKPILIRTDGRTEAVGACGTALGLLPDIETTGVEVSMAAGDTLVFFTDGVTERRDGTEFFGTDRTHAVLARLGGHDADIVAARLRAAAVAFSTRPPRDDIAILAVRNDIPVS